MKKPKLSDNFKQSLKSITRLWPLVLFNLIPVLTYFVYKEITNPAPVFQKSEKSAYIYTAEGEDFKVGLGNKEGNIAKVQFSNDRGDSIAFKYLPKKSARVKVEEEDGARGVFFNNVEKNIDLKYETLENGLKEYIVLRKDVGRNFFVFEVEEDGLTFENNYRNLNAPGFFGENGDYSFNIEKGFAFDGKGKRTDDVNIRFIQVDDRKYLRVEVDENWMNSSDRRYPIYIDPTIVIDERSQFENGEFNRSKDVGRDLSERLISYWKLDEASGTRNDSVGSNHLTDNNTVTSTTGIKGNAGNFTSANLEYLSIADNPSLSTGDIDFTISMWVNLKSKGANQIFASKEDSGTVGEWRVLYNFGDDVLRFTISSGSGVLCSTTWGESPSIGTWYNIIAWRESLEGTCNIIVNNGSISSSFETSPPSDTTSSFRIGARYSSTTQFADAYIDEVGFWKRILTSKERSALYNSGNANNYEYTRPQIETHYQELAADAHTVGLWHMNEPSGNVLDSSGNGKTGTPTGTTVVDGILGKARSFNGSSDIITTSNSVPTNTFTVEAWFTTNTTHEIDTESTSGYGGVSGQKYLFGASLRSADGGAGVSVGTNGISVYEHGDSYMPALAVYNGPVPAGWNHLAVVYISKQPHIYLNGILVRTGLTSPKTTVYAPYLFGGGNYGYHDGKIDEIRISNVARTPEEIKASATRSPYSIYTSEVIDFTKQVSDWEDLNWQELGVLKGDGETVFNDAGLVAQWNFNEISGTTLNNNTGSCGASCNGTLTNFASTTYRDQAIGTGWTSNNRRWGAGALMFDGTDDNVSITHTSALNIAGGPFTIETWVNPRSLATRQGIFSTRLNNPAGSWMLEVGPGQTGTNRVSVTGVNTWIFDSVNNVIAANEWSHIVYTRSSNSDTGSLYVNGKQVSATTTTAYTMSNNTDAKTIGQGTSSQQRFNGTIDSTRLYSRVLSADEILSNYNSSNLQIQTRVGGTTNPNDGSWEEWKPSNTQEQDLLSFDSSITKDLISYWKLDETSGVRKDSWGKNDLSDNNTVGTSKGIINQAASTDASDSEYLSVNSNSSLVTGNTDFTITSWVNLQNKPANPMPIITKGVFGGASGSGEYFIEWDNNADKFRFIVIEDGWGLICDITATSVTPSGSVWYFIATWVDLNSNTCNIQINNGTLHSTGLLGTVSDTSTSFLVGRGSVGAPIPTISYFTGLIDEVGFWKRTLTTEERSFLYSSGKPTHYPDDTDFSNLQLNGGIYTTLDPVIKILGSASQKLQLGTIKPDASTVGYWKLDETNGDNGGDDIFDSSGNTNHGEINGAGLATAVREGISGKSRYFNGSDDHIQIPDHNTLDITRVTVEAWVKLGTKTSGEGAIVTKGPWDGWPYYFVVNQSNATLRFRTNQLSNQDLNTSETIPRGVWTHVAATWDGSTKRVYINGKLSNSVAATGTMSATTAPVCLGGVAQNTYCVTGTHVLDGQLDEVVLSNVAKNSEQIAQGYKMSKDNYITKDISAIDLSDKSALSFYIASDRPGSFLQASLGETQFVNNLNDPNTIALYKFDEHTNDACNGGVNDVCDSSGAGAHGNVSSTPLIVPGIVGNARDFDGTDDKVNVPFTGFPATLSNITISFWARPDTNNQTDSIMSAAADDANNRMNVHLPYAGTIYWDFGNISSGGRLSLAFDTAWTGQWAHWAFTAQSGVGMRMYRNGQLIASNGTSSTFTKGSKTLDIGAFTTNYWDGAIDELVITSDAKSASQIRDIYERSLRTHQITIDFGASLDSGNLIANSGDTSFTIDATKKGLAQKGSKIFTGEKIIVKENRDGTEYIAQGTVSSVNESTGAVTVTSWDSGSTFPSSGFTAQATVFKWQKEYWPIHNLTLPEHIDDITQLSFRVTDGNEARTVWIDDLKSIDSYLTDPTGSTIESGTGNRYAQYRAILTSTDPKVSAALRSVSMEYETQSKPAVPSLDSPADRSKTLLSPALKTTANDSDMDDLQYKIILCKNPRMTYECQEFDQTQSQTGWSGQNAQSSTMYQSGTQATYTIQTPIEAGTTYYWKSYAIDPDGVNEWSETQSAAYVFNTNSHPRSPSVDNYQHFIARRENAFNATSSGWNSIEGATASGTAASTNGWINSSNLTAGDRYLIMVWGEHNSDNLDATSGLRVKHGSTAFSESQSVEKTGNTNTSHKTPYHWFTVWEAVSGESLEVELYWGGEAGSQARVEDVTLVAINAEELISNGDLVYDINTGAQSLTENFEDYAEITWTPDNDLDPWMILGYIQPSVKDNDGFIDSRLNINSTPFSSQRIENNNQFEDDTPLYSIGTVQTLTNDSITFSVQGKETGNSSIQTQDSVTFSPSTVVNDASVGAVAWINPAKATVSDDDYAVHNRASGAGYSNYLKATNFGFNIPVTATIDGIFVEFERSASPHNPTDSEVRIVKSDGSISTTNRSAGATWPYTDTYSSFGSTNDLWGESWTPSDINDSDFGVALSAHMDTGPEGGQQYVDHIRITVHYTEDTGPAFSNISSASILALNLNAFRDSIFDSYVGNGYDMNTPFDWVQQLNVDPLVKVQNNWLVSAGALVFDSGSQVITRIQSNDANITDDIGGWSKTNTHPLSTNLADLRSAWTAGFKNIDVDAQTTLSGNAQFIDGWLAAFSLEKATDAPGPRPDSPSNGATNQTLTPSLKMTAIDPDNDNLKYKVQMCTNLAMTTGCVTFDQTQSQTNWIGKNANSNTRYTSGTQANYNITTPLQQNTTYYWRPYAIDETALNVFSPPGQIFSFTTTNAPTAPTSLETEGQTNPSGVTDSTPEFTAIHNDPDGDNANAWKIQVNTASDFTGTMMWNPNKTSMTSTANGSRSPEIPYAGNTLQIGVTYYWRIKFWDTNDAEGAYSSVANFTMGGLNPVTGCYLEEADDFSSITVHWTDTNDAEQNYRVQRSVNGGAFSTLVTKSPNTVLHQDTTVSLGNTYQYRIAALLGPEVGGYCTTSTSQKGLGNIQFDGIIFQ